MTNKYYLIIFLFSLTFSCCFAQVKSKKDSLSIFKSIPSEIDGCSCYFSLSKKSFKENQIILFSNYQELAFIRFNGKEIRLLLKNNPEENNFKFYAFKNEEIELKMWIKHSKQIGEEVSLEKGKLKIYFKNKCVLKHTFYGNCGC